MAALLKKRALAEFSQVIQEEPQPKKLRLVKKPKSEAAETELDALEKCATSNEALQHLVKITEKLAACDDHSTAIKKLNEHFKQEKEPIVRIKILTLLEKVGVSSPADIQAIVDEIVALLKKETSHKVIAQAIRTLTSLGNLIVEDVRLQHKLVQIAKQYLSDTGHTVTCSCLHLIGELAPASGQQDFVSSMLRLVGDYTHYQDSRVRTAAFQAMLTLHERGLKFDVSIYDDVCIALTDDYEAVRQVALQLLKVLSLTYPEHRIVIPDSEEEIRLVDDAFGKMCDMISDLSLDVRVLAARLLGSLKLVSERFLEQTLDKKLMSNMRRKRSAHERQWESVTSGEWSSGKRWADDAPREVLDAEAVNLISSGACGAFVHGLEDEFMEVRSASLDSLRVLAVNNPYFAKLSLDYLVDMFNDEIEEVRIKAIDTLSQVSRHITLREDQLETILAGLEDFSMDIREGLYKTLAACELLTKDCLRMCFDNILKNLRRYPQDQRSIWSCLQKMGQKHPELTLQLVPELLAIHPFFDTTEMSVEDPAYICTLILVFNAAQLCPPMWALFEESTLRHYYYLRDTIPQYVPSLKFAGKSDVKPIEPVSSNTSLFLQAVFRRMEQADHLPAAQSKQMLETAMRDLECVAGIEPALSAQAHFASIYINCQLLYSKIISNKLWSNTTMANQQVVSETLKGLVDQLFQHCLKLQHLFVGLSPEELAGVRQLKLRTLALQLVYIVRRSNTSALAQCEHFVELMESLQRYLLEHNLHAQSFTESVIREMDLLNEHKPGAVARILLPLLLSHPSIPSVKITSQMKTAKATIYEPTGESDNPLKFTAGLVLAVPFNCDLTDVPDLQLVKIRVKYPDDQIQLTLPNKAEFRTTSEGITRLLTTILVSHQIWTEACHVEVGVVLDVTEPETNSNRKLVGKSEDLYLIDLCPSVPVLVSPKPVRKGI